MNIVAISKPQGYFKNALTHTTKDRDNAGTTKNHGTQCQALKLAFFVPNFHPYPMAGLGILDISRLFKKALNVFGTTDQSLNNGRVDSPQYKTRKGNKGSRPVAVVETRPPECSGGQTLTKSREGHTMPNTSYHGVNAVTPSSFSSFTLKNVNPNDLIYKYSCLLTHTTKDRDNAGTTKPQAALSTAVNSAFFMPNFHPYPMAGLGILAISPPWKFAGITPKLYKMGGLIAPNKRPHRGNKGSRLAAVVETRPPEHSGGQTLTKSREGHTMPNTSYHGANAVTPSSFSSFTLKNANPNDLIKGFKVLISPAGNCPYFLVVHLSTGQSSQLLNPQNGEPLTFDTLEEINQFLFNQGIKTYEVVLNGYEWRV